MLAKRLGANLPLLIFALSFGATASRGASLPPSAPLTSAADVRMLPPEKAARGLPVHLEGNMVIVTRPRDAIVLLDHTEAVYVELAQAADRNLQPGDHLAVEGVTDPGDFAPIVRAARVTVLGKGILPRPRPTTIAELNAGGLDAAWIELEGIVRACIPTPPELIPAPRTAVGLANLSSGDNGIQQSWLATFAQGDDRLTVQINGHVVPADLIDARVRIRGVVFNVHNTNRQFVRANMQVDGGSMIDVLSAPPADPFALPLQHVGEVLRFSPNGFTGHRVRLRGVVTGHKDRHTLWLHEGSRGMRVASLQEGTLLPGDEVDVVGFPDHGGYTPVISDAIFRRISAGSPPVPQFIRTPEEISRQDSNLVQLEAELTDVRRTADGLVLSLLWNGATVNARVLHREDQAEALPWEPGSKVRVAGICVLGETDASPSTGLWVPGDMEMLLRDSRDLVVLRAAPWLTTRRALYAMISVVVITLMTLVVVAFLARRQIGQREEARRMAEVEFAAMLAERNRLAREIHDTLAQELNAVSMQLELAKNSARLGAVETVVPYLAAAHDIVRQCIAEARESIWNMRSHILEKNDLAGALRTVAQQLGMGINCTIGINLRGKPRRLAPNIENNLLRIGQEAVSNALKHARPKVIEIELAFEGKAVRLSVRDDGQGFDPAKVNEASSHFGMRGMRERVAQMSGVFRLGRDVRGGTRVEVYVESPGGT